MTRTNKTVDTIVMAEDHILFIRRAKEPFMDKLVLPGGHIEETDQSPAHAATRELLEEVGLQTKIEDLHFLITLDSPGRDPRGSKVSQVFLLQLPSLDMLQACQAGSDAQEIVVREINSLNPEEVGFDHWLAVKLLQ
jgi:ADP-ribose pyrophosphatase YjhB (NUDIX family)